jgi:hypothetical protein
VSAEATQIRDLIIETIAAIGVLRAARIVPTFQWQPEDAPACGVYLRRERMAPDGDIEVGEVRFKNTASIGVSMIAKANSQEELAVVATQYGDLIEAAVLTSQPLFLIVEGVEGVDRTITYYPNASSYYAETRIEFEFQFRSEWPPTIVDDLRHVLITARLAQTADDTLEPHARVDLPAA